MASPIPAGKSLAVADVYRHYSAFCALAAETGKLDLAHCLVLVEPLRAGGEGQMVAASIASAGSLCIEPDTDAVRQGIRSGAIDFAVNNLDEALRALKNELRKGLSIAVCLEGEPDTVLAEMVERGVQPDFVCGDVPAEFLERGARRVELRQIDGQRLPGGMPEMSWSVGAEPGKWLAALDAVVANCLPVGDCTRRNWIKRAPRYLGRVLRTKRYLPMTLEENNRCSQAFAEELKGEAWKGITEPRFGPADWPADPTSVERAIPPTVL